NRATASAARAPRVEGTYSAARFLAMCRRSATWRATLRARSSSAANGAPMSFDATSSARRMASPRLHLAVLVRQHDLHAAIHLPCDAVGRACAGVTMASRAEADRESAV